jgi:tRNA(fMet)-specific endonuclease VapC
LLQARFELIAATFERIDWTDSVSLAFGNIKAVLKRKGRRTEDFDAAIAAHALANDATLVTSDTKHMADVPELLLEDWLTEP